MEETWNRERTARAIERLVGIDDQDVYSGVSPDGKRMVVEELQSQQIGLPGDANQLICSSLNLKWWKKPRYAIMRDKLEEERLEREELVEG
ncbi:hypothetical protein PPACK8108_LOCUS8354 [Phakopsora pachyrhizi]|uniref:Uncharacterized protein n=1 Tax=Phakopsora pachyrhizi TaxID=170000 RepID=A0AAV0AW33_PHAPC|nr:hypothetical protein PPACK8108_LOCUS8354 [Phakopsora pachyrhizi]